MFAKSLVVSPSALTRAGLFTFLAISTWLCGTSTAQAQWSVSNPTIDANSIPPNQDVSSPGLSAVSQLWAGHAESIATGGTTPYGWQGNASASAAIWANFNARCTWNGTGTPTALKVKTVMVGVAEITGATNVYTESASVYYNGGGIGSGAASRVRGNTPLSVSVNYPNGGDTGIATYVGGTNGFPVDQNGNRYFNVPAMYMQTGAGVGNSGRTAPGKGTAKIDYTVTIAP
jgi:hypothetical protein